MTKEDNDCEKETEKMTENVKQETLSKRELSLAAHFERVINNLNQHWHSIKLLLDCVSKPLVVDDRGLKVVFNGIVDKVLDMDSKLDETKESIKEINIVQALAEIKFIGKKQNEINERLGAIEKLISEQSEEKKIKLSFTCDGYELKKATLEEKEPDYYIHKLLSYVTVEERVIICKRLGLLGYNKQTIASIAREIQHSHEATATKYRRGMRKCRHPTRRKYVDRIIHSEFRKELCGESSNADQE